MSNTDFNPDYYDPQLYLAARQKLATGLTNRNPDLIQGNQDPNDPNVGIPVNRNQRPAQPTQSTDNSYTPPPLNLEPPPQLNLRNLPQPQQFDLAPGQQPNEPFKQFMNPVMLLAGVASLLTRRPLINAMTFASGALNGYQEGRVEQFNENKAKFHEALEAAMDQNKLELDKYNAAWKNREETNWQKTAPELQTIAAQNNDKLLGAAVSSGNWELVEKVLGWRQSLQNQYDKTLEAENAKETAREQEIDRLKKDPNVVARAKSILNYDQPPLPASRLNPYNQAVMDLVTEGATTAGEAYEAPNYGAKNKFVVGLGSLTPQSPGGQVTSMNTIVGHLNTLDKLADDLTGSSNTVAFRRATQALQIEFGLSSAPTNFDVARDMIGGEMVKLVVGAGGTGEDREKTRLAFDRANSPKLLHDAINTTREVIASRMESLINTAKGLHADKQLFNILKPETIKAIEGEKSAPPKRKIDREAAKAAGYTDKEIDDYENGR